MLKIKFLQILHFIERNFPTVYNQEVETYEKCK